MNWRIHSGLSVLFITLLLTWRNSGDSNRNPFDIRGQSKNLLAATPSA